MVQWREKRGLNEGDLWLSVFEFTHAYMVFCGGVGGVGRRVEGRTWGNGAVVDAWKKSMTMTTIQNKRLRLRTQESERLQPMPDDGSHTQTRYKRRRHLLAHRLLPRCSHLVSADR